MAEYAPPIEDLPIFNSINFGLDANGQVGSYLEFPIAQGRETFPDGIAFGDGSVQTTASKGTGQNYTYQFYTTKSSNSQAGSQLPIFKIVLFGGDPNNVDARWTSVDIIYLQVEITLTIEIIEDNGSILYHNVGTYFGTWALKPYSICYLASGTFTNLSGSAGAPTNNAGIGWSNDIFYLSQAGAGKYWASFDTRNSGMGSGVNNGVSGFISVQSVDGTTGSHNASLQFTISTGSQTSNAYTRLQVGSASVQVISCPPRQTGQTFPYMEIQGYAPPAGFDEVNSNVLYQQI
jgi:hypothetical protein